MVQLKQMNKLVYRLRLVDLRHHTPLPGSQKQKNDNNILLPKRSRTRSRIPKEKTALYGKKNTIGERDTKASLVSQRARVLLELPPKKTYDTACSRPGGTHAPTQGLYKS